MLLLVIVVIIVLIRLIRTRMIGRIIIFEVDRPGIDIILIHRDGPGIYVVKGVATAVAAAAAADSGVMMYPVVFDVVKGVAVWARRLGGF